MKKETLLLLAAFLGFMFLYPKVLKVFYPTYDPYKTSVKEEAVSGQSVSADKKSATPSATNNSSATLSKAEGALYDDTHDFAVKNGYLRLLFNPKDAAIRKISFLEYPNSKTKSPIYLYEMKEPLGGALDVDVIVGSKVLKAKGESKVYLENDALITKTSFDGDITLIKKFYLGEKYLSKFSIQLQNASDQSVNLSYRLYAGAALEPRNSIDAQYIETDFYLKKQDKKVLKHIKESKAGKQVTSEAPIEWFCIKDRHFSSLIRPNSSGDFYGVCEGLGDHKMSASLISPTSTVASGSSLEQSFDLYMGPNILSELEPHGLEALINFGKLDGIGRFLVGVLEMLQKVFRNYGLSIIALTALVNLCLFPFTRVSFQSMKRMQEIQPQVNKLREQHSKNPEKLNKEMMELYKKNKVNPFGGCLPMLLQMPVFIALYVALSKTVALVNAKFLWITDLSAPDRIGLPVSLPVLGNEIHLLPLIMIGGMVFQQKFTSASMASADPAMASQQKMMMVMMPLLFGFMFYKMPSGLVLYWLTNTIIMTSYQMFLRKSQAPITT